MTTFLAFMALAGVPLAFAGFCWVAWASGARAWFCYCAYFCLFGSIGGCFLAFAAGSSGLGASSVVFLLTLAPLACLAAAVTLTFYKRRIWCDTLAMSGCYLYFGAVASFWAGGWSHG